MVTAAAVAATMLGRRRMKWLESCRRRGTTEEALGSRIASVRTRRDTRRRGKCLETKEGRDGCELRRRGGVVVVVVSDMYVVGG